MIKDGIDATSVEGSKEIPYEVANFRCDLHTTDVGVPTLWWRSVGHTHTGYAVECFIDELLQAAGKDPVAGRLELMGKAAARGGCVACGRRTCEMERAGSGEGPRPRRRGGRKLQHLSSRRSPKSRSARATGRACTRCGARSIAASRSIPT